MSPVRLSAITILLATFAVSVHASPRFVETTGMWDGKIGDESLRKFAPKAEYIADSKTWNTFWKAWRPGEEIPKLDFDDTLVLVGMVSGPNLVIMQPTIDEEGNVRFVVGGTKIAGPGFGYKLVAIDRTGVKTVNGKPVNKSDEESITVKVVGKLMTGVIVIGGETTGTTITARGITWELEFGKNAKLRQAAEKLDGRLVEVEGRLERRLGTEIKERWIVAVGKLIPVQSEDR